MKREKRDPKWKLLVVDDHPIVRVGLRAHLGARKDLVVVGEAANGAEALCLARELAPDMVITELFLGDINGLELTRQLRNPVPQSEVLVFTTSSIESHIHEAIRCGASGYLLKPAPLDELHRAVEVVLSGARFFPEEALNRFNARRGIQQPSQLTRREQEILQLIARGFTNKEIADQLALSSRTVETHRQHLMEKLHIRTVAGLTRYAIAAGLISAAD